MRPTYGKYAALMLAAGMLLHMAAASPADQYLNSSEPAFLQNIGPQDDRADNPLAAAVTAAAVTAVIYRGLRRYNQNTTAQDD